MCLFCVHLADKFLETSFDDEVSTRQSDTTPRRAGDSPVLLIKKKNVPSNLPDWQLSSAAEPAGDSPVEESASSDFSWPPPVATEYTDQQPVTESPVHVVRKSDVSSQPVDWQQLDKPLPAATPPIPVPSITKQVTDGDSPVLLIRKKNVQLNLPDWQLSSAAEPAGDSPVEEFAAFEALSWPQVATEYADQQPVAESPIHVERKSDVSSQPVDWEQLDKPVPTSPPTSFPNVTKQIIEGDVYESEEKNETTEQAEDGSDSYVRRLLTTRRRLQPVTEVTLEDGVEVSRTMSDVVVGVHVDEFVDILPHGVVDPHGDGVERQVSVRESQESLETGGTLTRRVTTTIVRRLQAPEISRKPEEWHPDYPAGVEVMQDGKNEKND